MSSISVCLVTHNNDSTIKNTFESIMNQLTPDDELIVADTFSTDKTLFHIASHHDPRVVLLNNFKNPLNAWEAALKAAKNEFVFLANPSDKWLAKKVETYVLELERASLVLGNSVFPNGNKLFDKYRITPGSFSNLKGVGYYSGSIAFRNSLKELILPLPEGVEVGRWAGNLAAFFEQVVYINKVFTEITTRDIDSSLYLKPSGAALLNLLVKRGRA